VHAPKVAHAKLIPPEGCIEGAAGGRPLIPRLKPLCQLSAETTSGQMSTLTGVPVDTYSHPGQVRKDVHARPWAQFRECFACRLATDFPLSAVLHSYSHC